MLLLESIGQDIRYALRMMRNCAGLTTVAILSLALGIGATTAIFCVLNALMLKPLPVLEPDRLVEVARSDIPNNHTYAIWNQIRSQQDILSSVFAYGQTAFDLASGEEKHSVPGLYVSGDYFKTLGVSAVLGRTLTASDDRLAVAPVCVISYALWQRRYDRAQNVIGKMLFLDGHAFEVVGVAPRRFYGVDVGETFDVIVPLETERIIHSQRPGLDDPHAWWWSVVGRLKPGVSVAQADARLRVLGPAIFKASLPPRADEKAWQSLLQLTLVARPMGNGISYTRNIYGQSVSLIMVMVGVVLIIACTNLANLLLARSTGRQREIATRLALGASRWRLVRQLLTESLALSLVGAAVGLIVAHWGSDALVSAFSSSHETGFLDLSWDLRLVTFTLTTTMLCALLFGLAPALRAMRLTLFSAMKTRASTRIGSHRLSGAALIVTQVSLSMVLLVSAGLLVRTLRALLAQDLGYEPRGVLLVGAGWEGMDDDPQRQAFVGDELLAEFRSLPGVVSASRSAPTVPGTTLPMVIVHVPGGPERRYPSFRMFVSPGFFRTRKAPVPAGRDFGPEDARTSPAVAILSEAAARTFFPGVNPLGLTYWQFDPESNGREDSVEIVGIAKDQQYQRPNDAPLPIVYRPISQCSASCSLPGTYELRFAGSFAEIKERVKSSARNVDSHLGLDFRLMSDADDEVIQRERVTAAFAALFSLLTLALAVIGIYGVTSYATVQRVHEIGVRMALGAQPGHVLRMIVGEATSVVLVGVALGAAAGFGAAQAIRGVLFGVNPADPLTFAFAACLMLFVGAIAALLPAYRASRADPILALRVE